MRGGAPETIAPTQSSSANTNSAPGAIPVAGFFKSFLTIVAMTSREPILLPAPPRAGRLFVAGQPHHPTRIIRTGFITSRRVLTTDSPIRAHHPTAQACAAAATPGLRRKWGGPVLGHSQRGYETASGYNTPPRRRPTPVGLPPVHEQHEPDPARNQEKHQERRGEVPCGCRHFFRSISPLHGRRSMPWYRLRRFDAVEIRCDGLRAGNACCAGSTMPSNSRSLIGSK